ncbi:TIGR00730 family Rossman fold protein [Actinacidiphila glaucinigra]|uniref:LOG family protein n=1 Tax=Actinacidiphila glaucinigra TaxID=235986 RepID=UPI0033B2805F
MRDLTTIAPAAVAAPPTDRPRRFAVFCGSSHGRHPLHGQVARNTGGLLAAAGIDIVYGGARIGLMGALADAALSSGGRVTGVIPEALNLAGVVHRGLTSLEVVADMHARKARVLQLADAILVLPGGLGTLEEVAEVWSWAQLGLHNVPIALLNTAGFYDHLMAFLRAAAHSGFLSDADLDRVMVDTDPARLMTDVLARLAAAEVSAW